jgi:hypothetical protein
LSADSFYISFNDIYIVGNLPLIPKNLLSFLGALIGKVNDVFGWGNAPGGYYFGKFSQDTYYQLRRLQLISNL